MPHFPKPFYRKVRKLWYVEIDGKQINLGPDEEAAFTAYHRLMGQPKPKVQLPSQSIAYLIDQFLDWVQRNLAQPKR